MGSSLGLIEIDAEDTTGDGVIRPTTSRDYKDIIQAVDGLKLGTKHLKRAYEGGVLTAITAPMSRSIVNGISAAFKTGADSRKLMGADTAWKSVQFIPTYPLTFFQCFLKIPLSLPLLRCTFSLVIVTSQKFSPLFLATLHIYVEF